MGRIHELIAEDHRRLERLLAAAEDDPAAYVAFRGGLLRLIGIEEKILLPAARRLGATGALGTANGVVEWVASRGPFHGTAGSGG